MGDNHSFEDIVLLIEHDIHLILHLGGQAVHYGILDDLDVEDVPCRKAARKLLLHGFSGRGVEGVSGIVPVRFIFTRDCSPNLDPVLLTSFREGVE